MQETPNGVWNIIGQKYYHDFCHPSHKCDISSRFSMLCQSYPNLGKFEKLNP